MKVTAASFSDIAASPELLTGEEVVCGDGGHLGAKKRENAAVRGITIPISIYV